MLFRFVLISFLWGLGAAAAPSKFKATSVPDSPKTPPPFLVVIDPGHGGTDHGAIYRNGKKRYSEKVIVLEIAKEVARELRKLGIQAVLTRRTDKSLPLQERTAIANRLGAQIFISVHMNSFHKEDTFSGVETYVLDHSKNESSKKLAELENSVLDGSVADTLKQTEVALILKDLILDGNRKESQHLACAIQDQVVSASSNSKSRRRKNRGVKQAFFYVLLGADMPSILLETGFLNNARDRRIITSKSGRKRIARAIARAVDQFRRERGTKRARRTLSRCKIS